MAYGYSNLLGVTGATGASYTTSSITPTAGALLIVFVSAGGSGVTTTLSVSDTVGDSGGGTWANVGLETDGFLYGWFNVFYRIIGTGPSAGTVTITSSNGAITPEVIIDQITGASTSAPVTQSNSVQAGYSATGTVTLGVSPASTSIVYSTAASESTVTPAVTTSGFTAGDTTSGAGGTGASAYSGTSAGASVAWNGLGTGVINQLFALEIAAGGFYNSGPNYAGAASDMGGGSGSWSNVANAEGAPDGSTADWTAP